MPLLLSTFVAPAANGGCETSGLRLSVSQAKGDGTQIVVSVTNAGRAACDLGTNPDIYFTASDGSNLPLVEHNPFRGPNGMSLGVGPVVLPVRIPPSGVAAATTTLHAVAGEPGVRCVDNASINLHWQSTLSAPVPFQICFDVGSRTYFDQVHLQLRNVPAGGRNQ